VAARDSTPIYVWFRRNWLVLLAVLTAMWYAAVSQGNSAAYLLMFFLISLVGVSAIHAHFALAGLTLRAGRVEPVFAGERVQAPIEVVNPTNRARFALAVAPGDAVFKEALHLGLPRLDARGAETVEMSLPTIRRGRFRLERAALTTVYPLGFFRSWTYKPLDAQCLVYPMPAGSLPLPTGPAFNTEAPTGSGAGGDDYTGARAYQLGESQRHVDWRAVARGQPLLIKQFAGAGSRRVWLEYDHLAALPDVEMRLAQLSRWVVDAEREGCTYGLRLPGFVAEPARGTRHYHRCLGKLALFGEEEA
jgi:uncharacterized protein (DUF58 family)